MGIQNCYTSEYESFIASLEAVTAESSITKKGGLYEITTNEADALPSHEVVKIAEAHLAGSQATSEKCFPLAPTIDFASRTFKLHKALNAYQILTSQKLKKLKTNIGPLSLEDVAILKPIVQISQKSKEIAGKMLKDQSERLQRISRRELLNVCTVDQRKNFIEVFLNMSKGTFIAWNNGQFELTSKIEEALTIDEIVSITVLCLKNIRNELDECFTFAEGNSLLGLSSRILVGIMECHKHYQAYLEEQGASSRLIDHILDPLNHAVANSQHSELSKIVFDRDDFNKESSIKVKLVFKEYYLLGIQEKEITVKIKAVQDGINKLDDQINQSISAIELELSSLKPGDNLNQVVNKRAKLQENLDLLADKKRVLQSLTKEQQEIRQKLAQDRVFIQGRDAIAIFRMKVLDSMSQTPNWFGSSNPLEGTIFYNAFESILEDLKAFAQVQEEPQVKSKLNKVQSHLEFASSIAKELPEFQTEPHPEWSAKCAKKVEHQLKTENLVIIPGGNIGHAILYKIEKTSDGTYSFTIVNTGDEAVAIEIPKKGSRIQTSNLKYVGLTEKEISTDFLKLIFDDFATRTIKSNLEMIHKHLSKKIGNNDNLAQGRVHKMQQTGSCTISCILSNLHEDLGYDLYRQFKVTMTQNAIKTAEHHFNSTAQEHLKVILGINEPKLQLLYINRMLENAGKILQKRISKSRKVQQGMKSIDHAMMKLVV